MTTSELPLWARRLRAERERRPRWSRRFVAIKLAAAAANLRLGDVPSVEVLADYTRDWEKGFWLPGWRYQTMLAAVYGLSLRDLFGEHAALDVPPVLVGASGGTVDLPYFARAEEDRMQRRRFVLWLGALAAGTTVLPDSVRRMTTLVNDQTDLLPVITMDDVESLHAANTMFTQWQHAVGGGMSRRAVIGQLSWAVDHLEAGTRGTPEALDAWKVATTRLAGTAGWMCHDAGRAQQARALLTLGYQITSTVEADPRGEAQRANSLVQLARHAIDLDRPRTGLELLRQAQVIAEAAPPVTRSQVHAVKARAYGALGDEQAMSRELGLSEEEFARRKDDDLDLEPWLFAWHQPAQVDFNTGAARGSLMRARSDAADRVDSHFATVTAQKYTTSATALGDAEKRTRVSSWLRAATSLMAAGEPEQAVTVGSNALPALSDLRSKRIQDDAHELRAAAAPYRRRSDVTWLVHELSGVTV